jgi:glycosyltransferase EpsD
MQAALGVQPGQRMILSVGELISRKNYKTAIDIIARLNTKQVRYYICGQGVLRSEIEEYAKSRGVLDSVVFLGYRRDIPRICSCADVFLHTSCQEGLPVAIMEAMACGLPVVASRIRGNVDLIEDDVNGFLCAPQDVDGFVEKIRRVLDEPALAEELRSNGLQKIKGFDMSIVTKKLQKIYCGVSAHDSAVP